MIAREFPRKPTADGQRGVWRMVAVQISSQRLFSKGTIKTHNNSDNLSERKRWKPLLRQLRVNRSLTSYIHIYALGHWRFGVATKLYCLFTSYTPLRTTV